MFPDASAPYTVAIEPANTAPVAHGDAYSTSEGTPFTVPDPGLLGNDSDVNGDPLKAAVASGPTHGSLTPAANGSFAYGPDPGFVGIDRFTYRADDGQLVSASATVVITVARDGTAPAARADVFSTAARARRSSCAPGVCSRTTPTRTAARCRRHW